MGAIICCSIVAGQKRSEIKSSAEGFSSINFVHVAGGSVRAISDANTASSELRQLFQRAGSIVSREAGKIVEVDNAHRQNQTQQAMVMNQ